MQAASHGPRLGRQDRLARPSRAASSRLWHSSSTRASTKARAFGVAPVRGVDPGRPLTHAPLQVEPDERLHRDPRPGEGEGHCEAVLVRLGVPGEVHPSNAVVERSARCKVHDVEEDLREECRLVVIGVALKSNSR